MSDETRSRLPGSGYQGRQDGPTRWVGTKMFVHADFARLADLFRERWGRTLTGEALDYMRWAFGVGFRAAKGDGQFVEPGPDESQPSKAQAGTSSDQILLMQTPSPWAGAQEHADIVRELAERGPFWDYIRGCRTCPPEAVGTKCDPTRMHDPAYHEPRCLWRRARALYPAPAVPQASFTLTDPTPRTFPELQSVMQCTDDSACSLPDGHVGWHKDRASGERRP